MHPVQALKHRLQTLCGLSRFRQRLLFLDGDVVLDDEHTMGPGEVQVVRLNFCPSSQEQMNALRDAARNGRAAEVQNFLQRPQDPDSGHPTPLLLGRPRPPGGDTPFAGGQCRQGQGGTRWRHPSVRRISD